MEHGHDKLGELGRVLSDRLRRLVHDSFEELAQCSLVEGWLKARHGVQGDAQSPDITALIVSFVLDNLR